MKRKGLGKGLGMGYKNIAPLDSYIHSLNAKGIRRRKSLYAKKKDEGKLQIVLNLPAGLTPKQRKRAEREAKKVALTERQKKIARANIVGAGLGFSIGTFTGGFLGMIVGVPVGTLAGFTVGELTAGKPRGRKPKTRRFKSQLLTDVWMTRQEQVRFREQAERERKKAQKTK